MNVHRSAAVSRLSVGLGILFYRNLDRTLSPRKNLRFYQGKTLNIIINFAAGGPTDIETRIFAKHLTRHIPGQPTVTVQAMGGGGGITAVNLYRRSGQAGRNDCGLFHRQPVPPTDQRSRVARRSEQSSALSPVCMASPSLTFAPTWRRA